MYGKEYERAEASAIEECENLFARWQEQANNLDGTSGTVTLCKLFWARDKLIRLKTENLVKLHDHYLSQGLYVTAGIVSGKIKTIMDRTIKQFNYEMM